MVLVEEGLRGWLADVASKAVKSARVNERWRVETGEEFVKQLRKLARWTDEAGFGTTKIDARFRDEQCRA